MASKKFFVFTAKIARSLALNVTVVANHHPAIRNTHVASLTSRAIGLRSKGDVKMATLYAIDIRLVPMGTRDHLHDDQRAFLSARKACAANRACIGRLYTRRIAALQAIIDTRVYPHGPF